MRQVARDGTASPAAGPRLGIASALYALAGKALGTSPPIGVRTWDGTCAGPSGAPALVLRSPRALRRVLSSPGELGVARAYITGDIDVDGDLDDALRRVWELAQQRPARRIVTPVGLVRLAATAARVGALGRPPRAPQIEARTHGRLHSRRRDRAVVAHHYDTSNEFYELLLDSSMAYSCAYWTPETTDADLETAQRAKYDLVCRKLGLAPGMSMIDIGCGWGGLAIHAARHYGVTVVGITLSKEQLALARGRVSDVGLDGAIELRLVDYRDVDDSRFDAISAIEMGEHVGAANYPRFARQLYGLARPGGRVLVQQMSRHGRRPGGGAFIERYVAPDMHMRPVGETVDLIEKAGLEVRDVHALRENYARTIREWRDRLDARWHDAVGLLGVERARMWRMYLVGSALAFEQGRMGVDQILAVRAGSRLEAPTQPQR